MLILDLIRDPVGAVALITALVVGLTFHEYAHAWSANRLGDDTAARLGRLTLNPLKHLDPIGSLMMLIVGFGWAKPVPVNGWKLGRRGMLEVALAGPVSNLILATIAALSARALWGVGDDRLVIVVFFLGFFALLNLSLAFFNLIPVAPLDGSKVLMGLVSARQAEALAPYMQQGPAILLGLILISSVTPFDPLGFLISTPAHWVLRLLTGPAAQALPFVGGAG